MSVVGGGDLVMELSKTLLNLPKQRSLLNNGQPSRKNVEPFKSQLYR